MGDEAKRAACAAVQFDEYRALLEEYKKQSGEVVSSSTWLFGWLDSETTKADLGLSTHLGGMPEGSSLAERLAVAGAGAVYADCMSAPQALPKINEKTQERG